MRNLLHYLIGGLIGVALWFSFQGSNPIPELAVTIIVMTVIGGFWEIGRKILYGYKPDKMDVVRGIVGALIIVTIRILYNMRHLFFLAVLTVFLIGCSTDGAQVENKTTNATQSIVPPVYGMNGLYNRVKKKHYVNIQWYSQYGYPLYMYNDPCTVTILMDGVQVATNYSEQFNRFSVEVSNQWTQSTFEVRQVVNGVVSEPTFLTVYKYN